MQTESMGQMIDRLVIAALKVFHFRAAGNTDAATEAQVQVDQLATAVEVYDYECRTGQRQPRVQRALRYHDHNDAEGWRAGKKATPDAPPTLSGCVVALVEAHSGYWQKQGRLQALKGLIRSSVAGSAEQQHFEHEFVSVQRATDLHNQHRNQLIEQLDRLYAAAAKPRVSGPTLEEQRALIAKGGDQMIRQAPMPPAGETA